MNTNCMLVVDDEPHITLSLKYLFRAIEGVTVLTADNGQKAVQLAESSRPALVLLDIMMPVMDGLEACRRIREIPEYGPRPTIWLVTARGERVDRERGADVGANDYITKPYDPDQFVRRVREQMRAIAATAAAEVIA